MPVFETAPSLLILTAILAYLLGSTPFGIVMAKLFGLGDLRQIGSGNIGATNVLRTGNKPAAFLTLIGDAGKAGAAVLIARAALSDDAAQVAGLFAVLGHLYPVYLKFKGGKGVATLLGTVLALHWPVGLFACLTWLAIAAIFRISSLSALVASALAPIAAPFLGYGQGVALLVIIAVLVWYKHATNIRRILDGTEPRIGKSK
jgi:glycerol-3-phosphate acyltransferase PlsY